MLKAHRGHQMGAREVCGGRQGERVGASALEEQFLERVGTLHRDLVEDTGLVTASALAFKTVLEARGTIDHVDTCEVAGFEAWLGRVRGACTPLGIRRCSVWLNLNEKPGCASAGVARARRDRMASTMATLRRSGSTGTSSDARDPLPTAAMASPETLATSKAYARPPSGQTDRSRSYSGAPILPACSGGG